MAVRLRLVLTEGLEVDAQVDDRNNWTVTGFPPDVLTSYPELPEHQARTLTLLCESRGRDLGYLPDDGNRWAYAALEVYPGSEITGGLYRVGRMPKGPGIVY